LRLHCIPVIDVGAWRASWLLHRGKSAIPKEETRMRRLSLAIERIQRHYPVVVVTSGYGSAIAASRMARAGSDIHAVPGCGLDAGDAGGASRA
jgi:hypothetical protein